MLWLNFCNCLTFDMVFKVRCYTFFKCFFSVVQLKRPVIRLSKSLLFIVLVEKLIKTPWKTIELTQYFYYSFIGLDKLTDKWYMNDGIWIFDTYDALSFDASASPPYFRFYALWSLCLYCRVIFEHLILIDKSFSY